MAEEGRAGAFHGSRVRHAGWVVQAVDFEATVGLPDQSPSEARGMPAGGFKVRAEFRWAFGRGAVDAFKNRLLEVERAGHRGDAPRRAFGRAREVPELRQRGIVALKPMFRPERTTSGFCLRRWLRAMFTQSEGVPSIDQASSPRLG